MCNILRLNSCCVTFCHSSFPISLNKTGAAGKDEQGAAAGILVSAYAAGFVINPLTGMKLFDWNPDFPYFLGIILMIFCLIISILDKRLNIKVDFDEDIGHS